MGSGTSALDGWWGRRRTSKPARRRAAVVVLVVASCVGAIGTMFVLSLRAEPPRLSVAASAVVDDTGAARIVEAVDYRYTWSGSQDGSGRSGFLHVLSASGSGTAPQLLDVTADTPVEVVSAPQGDDLAVRVASPPDEPRGRASLGGVHHYQLRSKASLVASDGELSWDVLGRGWDDEVAGVAARLVGPWRLLKPRCSVVGAGPGYSCTARPGRVGELVVTASRIPAGARLSVTARRGAAVARPDARPVPVPDIGEPAPLHWWSNPAVMGAIVFLAALVPGLVLGWVLRRLGRDEPPVGGLDPTSSTVTDGHRSALDGVRVDDTRLTVLATPVSVPPQGLDPWQGAVIRSEAPDDASRIAWFLGGFAPGRLSFVRERARDGAEDLVLVRAGAEGQSQDGFDDTLDLAFAGRTRVRLGQPDRDLGAAWRTLEPLQLAWLLDAGLSDPIRARRVQRWRRTATLAALPLFLVATATTMIVGALGALGVVGGIVLTLLAAIGGLLLVFVLRVWELGVRTSLGSTWWVRTEAFRRYLADCGVQEVRGIADRGQLAFYTVWAVALGVTGHWTSTVATAGLPTDTAGLDLALAAPELVRAFRAVVYQQDAQAEAGRRARERRRSDRAARGRR